MSIAEIVALALVKYGPALARSLMDILSKPTPTPADWEAVFKLAEKSYEDYVRKP